MTASSWFLVVADYGKGTNHVTAFKSNDAAVAAYGEAETMHRDQPSIEVVLISSEDEFTLRRSYPHLFGARKASKRAAIRMLDEVAYC